MASAELQRRIKDNLIKTGNYDKSVEEKFHLHRKSYEKLTKIEKGNYYAGKSYLDCK